MEDDRDYTDYMQVKQQPSWLGDSTNERKNNQTADANDNFIKNSSDDYDNNFQNENVPHDHKVMFFNDLAKVKVKFCNMTC
jgi:hypothetical protein